MKLIPRAGHRCAVLVASLCLTGLAGNALAADPKEFSKAENLVFVNPHLANLKGGATTLRYGFVKSGALEPGFTDEVRIDVSGSGKTCCTVKGSFLSGERQLKLPEIPEAEANPVIVYFLEHDIAEMQRLTKGKSNYFRKRIRMTLVDEAKVSETTISYNGKTSVAQEVTLTPYLSDPARNRYERYAQKTYTFVLAKEVPGGVYQIRTSMSSTQPGEAAMIEEVMTLAGSEAAGGAKSASR